VLSQTIAVKPDGLVMVAATDGVFELNGTRDSKPSFEKAHPRLGNVR
jgi:hypothetical protein